MIKSHRFFSFATVLFFVSTLFLLSFFSHTASADDLEKASQNQAVAQVIWVKGTVQAINENKVLRELKRRDPIYVKDTIVTKEGSGQIVFSDNTMVALSPNTEMQVAKYHFTNGKDPKKDEYLVDVAKGGFRTITGAIGKSNPTRYEVKTPVATIGVRGTSWSLKMTGGKMYFKIETGKIQVFTPKGSVILDKSTNQLYATINMSNPVPVVTQKIPTAVFKDEPALVPAKSTLPDASTTTPPETEKLPAVPGGASGAGGGDGTTGGGTGTTTETGTTTTSGEEGSVKSESTSSGETGTTAATSDEPTISSDSSSSSTSTESTTVQSTGSGSSSTGSKTVSGFCIQ